MNNRDKDIYELLNDIEFDIEEVEEIPMTEIEKKKLKKKIIKQIRTHWTMKKKLIAISTIFICILIMFSPIGRQAIAAIKEKLFFNPGLGLVNVEEEIYVLEKPIIRTINGKEVLIKSIASEKERLNIGIWISDNNIQEFSKEEFISRDNEIQNSIYVKLSNGDILKDGEISMPGGGKAKFYNISYKVEEIITQLTLVIEDEDIDNIKLINPQIVSDYNSIGGNALDNNLLIGANKYNFQGNTYLSLWNCEEFSSSTLFRVSYQKEDILVSSQSGEQINIEPSNYDGLAKEFVINQEIVEPLNIKINRVELGYNLKDADNISVKIPNVDETIQLDMDIYFPEINQKVLLKSITRTSNGVELIFDTKKYAKDNSVIIGLTPSFRNCWGTGNYEDNTITIGFDNEDLSLSEKLTGKIKFRIKDIDLYKMGNWDFTIE